VPYDYYFFGRRVLAGTLLRRRARRKRVARGLGERAAGLRVQLPQVRCCVAVCVRRFVSP
jgi:hypothetical protein